MADCHQNIRSLINHIEPFPTPIPHSQNPTIVLLVTPSFASSLKAPNGTAAEAIDQAASRILKNSLERSSPLGDIRVIAAVVDRLPVPADGSATNKASEGLAYALWYSDKVVQTHWKSKPESSQDERCGTLSFDVWDRQGPMRNLKHIIHRVRLALANTIFQTGQKSTMFNILYKASEIDDSQDMLLPEPRSLSPISVESVPDQLVQWPVSRAYMVSRKIDKTLHKTLHELRLNLVPLTASRPVYAGMGNIIRQVSNSEGNPQPASQELERAVSCYFSATDQEPHPMPVWAIVSTQRSASMFSSSVLSMLDGWPEKSTESDCNYIDLLSERIHETWTIDPKALHPLLWKYFKAGDARVHRVLSGGGGWGKKAGLLSLDPARVVSHVGVGSLVSSYDDRLSNGQQPLQEVAKPGLHIQFFASPVSSLDTPPYAPDTRVFGTLPSSIDEIPETAREEPSGIELWPGYFGALSEQGMSITLLRNTPGQKKHFARSVFDVPYSLFVTKPNVPGGSPQHASSVRVVEHNQSKVSYQYS